MRRMMLVVITAWCAVQAQGIHVMFAGIEKANAPVFGNRYDQGMRDRLNAAYDVTPIDWGETQRLAEKIGLTSYSQVSLALVHTLQRYVADSTLLVWGRVEKYSVEAKRRGIFRAHVVGTVSVALMLYSLSDQNYMFVGKAEASTDIKKPPAWFRKADEVTHISAEDRDKIADELARQTADKTTKVISAVVYGLKARQSEETTTQTDTTAGAPNIYDMLQVPSDQTAPQQEAQPPAPQEAPQAAPAEKKEAPMMNDLQGLLPPEQPADGQGQPAPAPEQPPPEQPTPAQPPQDTSAAPSLDGLPPLPQ
jgi:hypothetical protein